MRSWLIALPSFVFPRPDSTGKSPIFWDLDKETRGKGSFHPLPDSGITRTKGGPYGKKESCIMSDAWPRQMRSYSDRRMKIPKKATKGPTPLGTLSTQTCRRGGNPLARITLNPRASRRAFGEEIFQKSQAKIGKYGLCGSVILREIRATVDNLLAATKLK